MEQPPKRHGSVHPAAAGVAGSASMAIMMLLCNIIPNAAQESAKNVASARLTVL
jgi:hypothetical protein